MPVTRDAEYPAELADMFQAFNRCAEGHKIKDVVDVAMNFTIAAIGHCARAHNMSETELSEYARANSDQIFKQVLIQAARPHEHSDVSVPMSGQ